MILGTAILNTNRLDPGLAEIQASSLPHVSCQISGQRAAGMERAEGTSFAESVRDGYGGLLGRDFGILKKTSPLMCPSAAYGIHGFS